MKNRSRSAQLASGLLLAVMTCALSSCANVIYKDPQNNYSGRPIPPSGLLQRVMVAYTANGSNGGLQILDGLRDLRTNVQNTIQAFPIAGVSAQQPNYILNFPEQTRGYVLSYTDGSLIGVNYSTEAGQGSVASFGAYPASAAASPDGSRFSGANETAGGMVVAGASGSIGAGTFGLNLPNVYKVAINAGNSVILAMVRNSNTLYRVIKLPASNNPVVPPGSVDCEPLLLPVYCVVPVKGTFDRPTDVYFSNDGNTAYVLNCGPECGGTTASVAALQVAPLIVTNVPTVNPLDPSQPTTLQTLPVPNPIPIPGGVTGAVSDGANLYLAGQSLFSLGAGGALGATPRTDGLFTGYLTTLNLSTYAVSNPLSIADGTHTSHTMILADDSTLWIGAQQCANGERAAQAARGATDQSANYNCLAMVKLGAGATAQIVPAAVTGSATVPYPNSNQNPYYYGSLTGICWVQNYHKVYTAYGGQIHAFYTGGPLSDPNEPGTGTSPAAGTEVNNTNILIQGTVLDVAYMDALTNAAN